jgi:hypothetical protein
MDKAGQWISFAEWTTEMYLRVQHYVKENATLHMITKVKLPMPTFQSHISHYILVISDAISGEPARHTVLADFHDGW